MAYGCHVGVREMPDPFGGPNVQMGSFALLELPEEFFSVTPSEHERSIITVGRIWPRHLSSFEMKHLHWRLHTFLHWTSLSSLIISIAHPTLKPHLKVEERERRAEPYTLNGDLVFALVAYIHSLFNRNGVL